VHGHHHMKGFIFFLSGNAFISIIILNTEGGTFHVAIIFIVISMLSALKFSSLVNTDVLSGDNI